MAEWLGIQTNHCMFQGKIEGKPIENNGYVFMTLLTKYVTFDKNGQWTEVPQKISLIITPESPLKKVALNNVDDGRKLQAWCQYMSWETNGTNNHGFVVSRIDLGDKPYKPDNQ